jgi:hypothetical protein
MLAITRTPATARMPSTAGRDESNSRNAINTRDYNIGEASNSGNIRI